MNSQNRPKVLVAGAAGSIGTAVCRDLSRDHDVIAMVGPGFEPRDRYADLSVTWSSCEPFSQREVEAAVTSCDYAVYLAHTRLRTARLDQAASEDMDLLVADNFARAAKRAGISQILHLHGITREYGITMSQPGGHVEVSEALSFYGTPVTTLSSGLILAPGSHVIRLFGKWVLRFPLIILPQWANTQKQPIAVPDLLRALRHCLGNSSTFNQDFQIGGTTILSVRELLRTWAAVLDRKRLILFPRNFNRRLFAAYLRLLDPQSHPDLVRLLVDNLRGDSLVRDNVVQQAIEADCIPARQILDQIVADAGGRLHPNPREGSMGRRMAFLRARSTVRSVQRVALPRGRNATWVADTYFRWLPRFVRPWIRCQVEDSGFCAIFSRVPPIKLLELTFKPDHSSPRRRMYFISGGALAKKQAGPRARMEFRDMLGGRFTIIAIHDFSPRLSWGLYSATQALFHGFVMRAFQRYLSRKSSARSRIWERDTKVETKPRGMV